MTKQLKAGDKLVLVSMGKVLKHYKIFETIGSLAFGDKDNEVFDVELKEDNQGRYTALIQRAPMYNTFDIYLDESGKDFQTESGISTFTLEEIALRMNVPVEKLVIISATQK